MRSSTHPLALPLLRVVATRVVRSASPLGTHWMPCRLALSTWRSRRSGTHCGTQHALWHARARRNENVEAQLSALKLDWKQIVGMYLWFSGYSLTARSVALWPTL